MTKSIEVQVAEMSTLLKTHLETTDKNHSFICKQMENLDTRITRLEHWETKTKTGWTALGLAFGAGGVTSQFIAKITNLFGG